MTSYNTFDFDNTISCVNDSDCSDKYNSGDQGYLEGNWSCNDGKCKKQCFLDSDCGVNNMCVSNKCENRNYQKYIVACNTSDNNFPNTWTSTGDTSISESLDNCLDYARSQTKSDDVYISYKDPIQTPIDFDNVSVNIKCNNDSGTYNNDFDSTITTNCLNNSQHTNCEINLGSLSDTGISSSNCDEFKLTYSYKCKNALNEDANTKTVTKTFNKDEINDVTINMTCPIDSGDYSAKCSYGSNMPSNVTDYNPDTSTSCTYPIYYIAGSFDNQDDLESKVSSGFNNKINTISEEIDTVNNQLRELQARKLMNEQLRNGVTGFTLDDAYDLLDSISEENELSQTTTATNDLNTLNNSISDVFTKQEDLGYQAYKLENEKMLTQRRKLNNLDKRINNITSNIHKSQTQEKVQISMIKYGLILLTILTIFCIISFIYYRVKYGNNN